MDLGAALACATDCARRHRDDLAPRSGATLAARRESATITALVALTAAAGFQRVEPGKD
jgi:hypothetical protein